MTHKVRKPKPPRPGPVPGRKDQAKGRQQSFWDEQVILFLVNGGTLGRTQREIMLRYKGTIDSVALNAFLEALREEGKLDRFRVPHPSGKGNPRTVWRATTKILES